MPHARPPQLALPPGGSVLSPNDYITNVQKETWKQRGQDSASAVCAAPSWTHSWNMARLAAPPKLRGDTARLFHAAVCGTKLADPGITTEPRGLSGAQSRTADIFTTAAVPGRSAALDVCVASSNSAAVGGDAAQPSFDRKLSHYRIEMSELRNQGINCRRSFGQRTGDHTQPSLEHCSMLLQELYAKSLQRRWKHEIQIALPRRRAEVTRAVLPNPSARAEWLLARIIDRAVHHRGYAPPLDGGPHQMTTMTSPPSPVNRSHLCSHQASKLPRSALTVQFCFLLAMIFPGDFVSQYVPRGSTSPFDLELVKCL